MSSRQSHICWLLFTFAAGALMPVFSPFCSCQVRTCLKIGEPAHGWFFLWFPFEAFHKGYPQTKTHPSGLSREVLHGAVRIDGVQFYGSPLQPRQPKNRRLGLSTWRL